MAHEHGDRLVRALARIVGAGGGGGSGGPGRLEDGIARTVPSRCRKLQRPTLQALRSTETSIRPGLRGPAKPVMVALHALSPSHASTNPEPSAPTVCVPIVCEAKTKASSVAGWPQMAVPVMVMVLSCGSYSARSSSDTSVRMGGATVMIAGPPPGVSGRLPVMA
jgi:hypothetical protein